ncbi:MAG: DUF58 domain-containing protein [Flavobacteriales bacterium]|nr:DUF58 domain-containing protein [Flavobacteriales bacterium]
MKFIKSLYINQILFNVLAALVVLFITGFFFTIVFIITRLLLLLVFVLFIIDILFLYRNKTGVFARRDSMDKLSNGDKNEIQIVVENAYQFTVKLKIIDEIPFQFQARDTAFKLTLEKGQKKLLKYYLYPVERGEYSFGAVNVYATGVIGFVSKRYQFSQNELVPVYPSFMQMRKYELMAISNRLTEVGVKKIRKIGQNTEFEQIKEYVFGDDFKTINWKATARRSKLMVNQYQDERSQNVYSIIDMGRAMKMPFNGLTLVDYAINSSLVISNIAIQKHDKAGLMTFNNKMKTMLAADRKGTQMRKIMELLYNQKTGFADSNFEALNIAVKYKINQRSLVLLYTNFETMDSLNRQMKYLRSIAKSHLLVVIFFENTELIELINKKAENTLDIYKQTIAEKFAYEKRLIVKELKKYGIHSILTEPENLTVNSINKYLEIKARNLL